MVKCNAAVSECFPCLMALHREASSTPQLFNIYVDVLSQRPMQKLCYSFRAKIVNHLYYADDLALIAPSSNGMQKLITECESNAEVYGMKFNEMKSVLSPFYPANFRFVLIALIVPVDASCWYLGHIIINDLHDNDDIRRQPRRFSWKVKHVITYLLSMCICMEITSVYVLLWESVHLKSLV